MPLVTIAIDHLWTAERCEALSAKFESAWAGDIIAWAAEEFGDGLVATSSFEDGLVAHLVATNAPGTEVAFLDTQYHFAQTWWLINELQAKVGDALKLAVIRPAAEVTPDNRWRTDIEGCCALRKVEPLRRALQGRTAWITGLRRADGPTRASAPVVSFDEKFGVVKINPIATWSDDDVEAYMTVNELPRHPLLDEGYSSIGCWPCTSMAAPGDDKRAGRWAGSGKTECGLHA